MSTKILYEPDHFLKIDLQNTISYRNLAKKVLKCSIEGGANDAHQEIVLIEFQ